MVSTTAARRIARAHSQFLSSAEQALAPKMRIILISAQYDRAETFQNLVADAGAEAYIPKDDLDLEVVKKWVIKADNETDTNF